jgi:hypothetical protein
MSNLLKQGIKFYSAIAISIKGRGGGLAIRHFFVFLLPKSGIIRKKRTDLLEVGFTIGSPSPK